jgi:DNA-directed RNA polymerase
MCSYTKEFPVMYPPTAQPSRYGQRTHKFEKSLKKKKKKKKKKQYQQMTRTKETGIREAKPTEAAWRRWSKGVCGQEKAVVPCLLLYNVPVST